MGAGNTEGGARPSRSGSLGAEGRVAAQERGAPVRYCSLGRGAGRGEISLRPGAPGKDVGENMGKRVRFLTLGLPDGVLRRVTESPTQERHPAHGVPLPSACSEQKVGPSPVPPRHTHGSQCFLGSQLRLPGTGAKAAVPPDALLSSLSLKVCNQRPDDLIMGLCRGR